MANKEFDNVQLFAEYDSSVGSNVMNVFGNKSKENIAYSLSKIKNWFPWLVPTNGSTGQILEWYNNVPTWRANTNADTVKQTHSTDTDFHPLVLGAPHSASAWGSPISETTDQVYMNKGIYVKPSTSTIYATAFVGKVTHPTIPGTGADTTSSVTPLHGQGFTTVDVVTRDSNGHVTGINTKTVTLPAQYVHPTYTRTDTASTASPAHGGTFTAIDSVTSTNGHVTAVNLKTVTLPAQYVHPTYIDKTTADFYKIKITNGHISAATAIAKGDVSTFLNLLDTGSSTPTDADYYISQYVGGGTTTTSYHRRPMSALWSYVKGKADSIYAPIGHSHPLSIAADTGNSQLSMSANTKYKLTAGGSTFIFTTPPDSDTKVTSSTNHYTPATVSGQDKTASASGATAAWSIDVVKGVTLNTDGKGHVTGISVTSGKIPANPVPSNNVTGNGTSGYLTKWNGTNSITNGPKLGSSTTTFLRNDGTWAAPLGTANVGTKSRPIYLAAGVPTQCDTPASGAWWNGVPLSGSDGVMEIGKYIDFHASNGSTLDYDYRIEAETQILHFKPKVTGATYNLIQLDSPEYNQIRFSTSKSGKAQTTTGIVVYPLTTNGQVMTIQSDGNLVIGGGESPTTLYNNNYDTLATDEWETLYLASDSGEIHFVTNCQAYAGRKVLKVQDGQLVKTGGMWISARDTAPVYANKPNAQDGGYYPAWFAKTKSGGWSMGVLSTQDNLYLTYTTDTDYSGGSNTNTYQVQFQNKSGTVALTSDLAGYVPMETVTTDTSADNYFTKTAWVNWNKNAGTSTTNLPTSNWGLLLTKALPSVQVFIPDNASGLYFRRKADASTAATAWWGVTGTAGNTYNLANISNTGFGYRTLNATTVNTTAGSFVFGGDALLGGVNDWAGIQVEGINDRFQLLINGHLMVRQNDDATISAAGWAAWTSCLRPADVSGSGGITVTQNDVTIGSGSTATTYKGTVTISHSNSITASTSTVFKKFSYDANGHITGTAAVAASDIPALNYVPNTQAGVNAAINLLSTGTSTPTDADYYISQYVGGGTTTTTYHRRPMSALWSYVKGKADSVYLPIGHTYPLSIAADAGTNQLTLSANTKYKLTAGGSTFIFTTPTDNDTKVNVTLATTTKAYLLGTSTTPTNTAQPVTSIADTGVYLGTGAGSLYATTFYENGTALSSKYAASTHSHDELTSKALTASTFDSTSGNFFFKGSSLFGGTDNYDWVGIQADASNDKFQLVSSGANGVYYRARDDDSTGWSDWHSLLTNAMISGSSGITVTPNTIKIGGDSGSTVNTGVTISHSNSITAVTTVGFYKFKFDAQGHITGTASVDAADLPSHTHSQYYDSTISRTANTVLAAPNGSNGGATFRKLVAADIPALNYSKVSISRNLTSGTKVGTITIDGTATDLYCQTNTDVNVTQTATTTNADYEILFSATADNTTRTETARKNSNLKFNPSTGSLYASKYYGEFECLNEVADDTSYAMVLAANPNTHQPNTLRKTPNVTITFKNGTASEEGWAQITLGNSTQSGTAGNETGWLKLYSPSSGVHYITGASTTSAITHTLPATTGTILNSGTTSFTQSLSSGTKIGSIKINGTSTDIYAPTNTDTKVTQTVSASSNTSFRPLLLGASWFNEGGAPSTVTDTVMASHRCYIQPSTGDITLYSPSGDSPGLIFKRGTNTDNLNDWKIYDKGGMLYFARNTSGSSTWADYIYFDKSTIYAHDVKLDGGGNGGITINYDSGVSNYSGINYKVGNVIQSQFGWFRPSSGTGAYYYFGDILGDTRAYHDKFYSKKYTVASSSSTSYNATITGSFTTNRTITIPDSSGTISVSSVALTSTGTTSGYVDVPTGSRYLIVEVKIAATSVKSFHKVAIDTSCTSTSLIQTTTKGQYGLQLTIQPIQFTLTNATSITGGTRYTLTMNVGSVMSISAGTTPSAASASPQIVKVYAQA